MGENSKIEWTDFSFNPWIGCTKVSPACANCYAERDWDHRRHVAEWGPNGTRVVTSPDNWKKPLRWERQAARDRVRRRVFCASLADVFEDWDGIMHDHRGQELKESMMQIRHRLFKLIDDTPHLDWLLLTKRPERVLYCTPERLFHNVWLGTSVENQEYADLRLPLLEEIKASGRFRTTFVSAEPLVGPIRIVQFLQSLSRIDWVITGGESGPAARPCDPEWFRSLRDQCVANRTPFLFKQWGEFDADQVRVGKKNAGRELDGKLWDQFPEPDWFPRGWPVWTRTTSGEWINCTVEQRATDGQYDLMSQAHGYVIARHQSEIYFEPVDDCREDDE